MSFDHTAMEAALGLTLPRTYTDALNTVITHCGTWRDPLGPFLETDVENLISLNQRLRSKPSAFLKTPRDLSRSWPKSLVACFATERLLCFFDSSAADPQIQYAVGGALQEFDPLRSPSHYANFEQMAKYCVWKYRNQISWETKSRWEEAQREEARSNKTNEDPAQLSVDLIAEGQKLARPALLLREQGSAYAAVLEGQGIVPPSLPGKWHHRLSFSCDHLPINPRNLRGVISAYWQDDYLQPLAAFHDPEATLPMTTDGTKLYGTPFECLPSVGAVLAKGSAAVQRWTRAVGEWIGDLDNYRDYDNVAEYTKFFEAHHPHWADPSCRMMLGGWGAVFPEADWIHRMNETLLTCQLRDEPWLEVYDTGTELQVDEHVT